MQGTHTNDTVLDLNALLAERRLDPKPVRLGEDTYYVNTDLTAVEANAFIQILQKGHNAAAFTLLIGTKDERARVVKDADRALRSTAQNPPKIWASDQAVALDKFVDTLPRMHQALVSGQMMRASKALAEFAKQEDAIYAQYGYELEGSAEGESPAP